MGLVRTGADPAHRPLLVLLGALAVLNGALFLLYLLTPMPALWSVSFLVYVGIYLFSYRGVRHLFDEAFHLEQGLRGFRAVAALLEAFRYGPHRRLAALCAPLLDPQDRPSRYLRRAARIAAAASSQKSEILRVVLNALMP